jgi:hypothetical protein
MLLYVLISIVVGAIDSDAATPRQSVALFLGVAIVLCARNLRKGWRGPRIFLAVIAALLVYVAVSSVALGLSAPDEVDIVAVIAVVVSAVVAVVGTVLMFRPEANAYFRAVRDGLRGR